jgi:hypothetical protein
MRHRAGSATKAPIAATSVSLAATSPMTPMRSIAAPYDQAKTGVIRPSSKRCPVTVPVWRLQPRVGAGGEPDGPTNNGTLTGFMHVPSPRGSKAWRRGRGWLCSNPSRRDPRCRSDQGGSR